MSRVLSIGRRVRPPPVLIPSRPGCSATQRRVLDVDAHRASGALDLEHGGLDAVRIEVGHLDLGDLADLVA
jgi:hypothetical protein